jgi:L-glutamine-phosphate cytidylyltransferase
MKMILLAAGKGKRLRPLTNDRPKCLVEIAGKTLLDWQITTARKCGISEIIVVKGYMAGSIQEDPSIKYYINDRYGVTNMVETLWCAENEFNDEIIISYADILYEERILNQLIQAPQDINIIVDKQWRTYWEQRFPDPVQDAESLKLNTDHSISEIGKKISDISEPDGQYIGLLKFGIGGVEAMKSLYQKTKNRSLLGEKPFGLDKAFDNLYMTDFLQGMIGAGYILHSVPIDRGWLEIDTVADYELACSIASKSDTCLSITG